MTVIWAALATGAVYALVAAGFNITYIWAGILNFAQPMFVVIGAFVGYWTLVQLKLPAVLGLLAAAVVGAAMGFIQELIGVRPLAGKKGTHTDLIVGVGVATCLIGVVYILWGPDPLQVPSSLPAVSVDVLGGRLTSVQIALVVVATVVCVGLHFWNRMSATGLAGLARTQDREAAQLCGVNTMFMSSAAFTLAGAFGAVVGMAFVGPSTYAVGSLGIVLAIKGFVALVLGGVGRHLGALVGGLLLGLLEGVAAWQIGEGVAQLLVFGFFLLILLLRPQGLFGRKELRGV